MPNKPDLQKVGAEDQDLRARLEKAEESLREILSGEADALFVAGAGGAQLFTLKGADQSYRTLIENMSEGAFTLTPAGLILYANRRFSEMLRTPLERVIGSEIHTWLAPESRQVLQTLLRKDAVHNRREELALTAADGTQVPVNLSVNDLNLEGMPNSFCMVATDLTQQKRNEAILAAEALAQAILEQAADAIVICNETGRIIRASKQAQAFCGDKPLGQHFEHAFPLRELDGTAFSPIGVIDTTRRQSVEARLEHNGQEFDLLVSVGHLKGARNELLGSVVTLTDITESKRAEEALRESEARFRSLTEMSSDFYWESDTEHRLTARASTNEKLNAVTAFRRGAQIGQRRWEIPYLSPSEAGWEAHRAVLDAHLPFRDFELSRLAADGAERHISISGDPVFDASGAFRGYRGVGTDITERKLADQRITYLNRVYAMLSSINALIVRAHDRDELFREACGIAVEAGGFRIAWIGIVDRGSTNFAAHGSVGVNDGLLAALKDRFSLSASEPLGNTIVARVVRESKAIVSNELQSNPEIVFGKQYAESGINSMAILPLIVADEAMGVLALYAKEDGFFRDEEMKLLTELAGDISFAIDHIEKQERLDYLAYYDVLTGLANRRLFLERVTQYRRSAVSGGHKLAVILIDLERFKSINDSFGRPVADALLRQVAEWLTQNAGDANLLARVGADHFAAVLPIVKQEGDAARLIEKMMKALLEHPFRLNDAVFRIGAKVGIALFPDDGADADTLFNNAEAALKQAKARGDRYLFHTQKMTATVAGAFALENQLRQALDNEEFVLHYQPKVDLVSGKVTSAEALIRWNDPRTGLVPPGRFIPILEETGLIYEVGRWALRTAIADYLRWCAAGLPAVRIAVNVSPLQLRNRDFISEIEQVIGIDHQAPAGLELEITESVIMEDVSHNIASLKTIRDMGVTIAIDDFGTGFSSLAYLSKLPVDTLKIDRSFVIDMTASPEGLSLVSTITNLAHSLRLKVVAEGVETEEQSRLLRLLSCDEMQGFLFSKPVPGEIFEAKFLRSASGT